MVRSVLAEEKFSSFLLENSNETNFTVGLILGQSTAQKDYVIHLANTPLQKRTEEVKPSVEPGGDSGHNVVASCINEVEELWMSTHARNVTRMLPGGMWVIGFYIVSPDDIFGNKLNLSKVTSLVSHIHYSCKNNVHLQGQTPCKYLSVLHFNSVTKKYFCKGFEIDSLNISMRPTEWKFQTNFVKWIRVDCGYDMSTIAPYYLTEKNVFSPLKKNLKALLSSFSEDIKKSCCTINGKFRDSSETIESLQKQMEKEKKDDKGGKTYRLPKDGLEVKLYMPQEARNDSGKIEVKLIDSAGGIKCDGYLSSQVFLSHKATMEDIAKAVKEDIVRSWAARLEMHWDSYEKKAEEKEEVHLLPRRVLCPLPNSNFCLSEYIFPDEGVEEAISSLQEQLGISILVDSVDTSFEKPCDPKISETRNQEGSTSRPNNSPGSRRNHKTNALIVGIIIAAFILVFSIVIQYRLNS